MPWSAPFEGSNTQGNDRKVTSRSENEGPGVETSHDVKANESVTPASYRDSSGGIGRRGTCVPPMVSRDATSVPCTESLDSDMLSISDSSEPLDPFGLGPAASVILTDVLHVLLKDWQDKKKQLQSSEEPKQRCTSRPERPSRSSSSATGPPCKRRRLRAPDDRDEDADLRGTPVLATETPKPGEPPRKLFACPFWKKNPTKHQACFPRKLARIRDVKQHLTRKHCPLYCESCKRVFEQLQDQQEHVVATGATRCVPRPFEALDGVKHHQQRMLREKSNSKHTAEEQWYVIWDILFEDIPRPNSPYMDFERTRDFDSFVQFCQARVSAILKEQLTHNALREMLGASASELQDQIEQTIRTGFQAALESFVSTPCSAPEDGALASGHPTMSESLRGVRDSLRAAPRCFSGGPLGDSIALLEPSIPPESGYVSRTASREALSDVAEHRQGRTPQDAEHLVDETALATDPVWEGIDLAGMSTEELLAACDQVDYSQFLNFERDIYPG